MKKIIITCLMALFACNLKAQTNVDSLINVLNTQKLTVEEQLDIYKKLCDVYKDNNIEKFMVYAEKGLQLAQKENNKPMISEFYRHLGKTYELYRNLDTAKICYEKALELAVEAKDRKREAETYNYFGDFFIENVGSNLSMES